MNTASTPSTVTSEGQARKLVDQLTPRLVAAVMDGRLPAEQFQQLIQQEKELKLGTRFVEWLLGMMAPYLLQWVVVRCDYGAQNAISEAMDAANFDDKYLDLSVDQIPLIGSGKVDHQVGELHFGKPMKTNEVIAAVKDQTAGFATPLAALRYAAMLPDRQRQYPLAIIFEVGGRLWHLTLFEGGGLRYARSVHVRRYDLVSEWDERDRFLVVRKACPPVGR